MCMCVYPTIRLKPIQRPTRFKRYIPLVRHNVAYVSSYILHIYYIHFCGALCIHNIVHRQSAVIFRFLC